MKISKWLFKDFPENVVNYNYVKTIPFCAFSDTGQENYGMISDVLDSIGYNKELFVSIGKVVPPFGIHAFIEDNNQYNQLLNSCQISFVLQSDLSAKNDIIRSTLAGIMPICNKKFVFSKQLSLQKYMVDNTVESISSKIKEILDRGHIYKYDIYWKSWKYNNQVKKWR